MELEKGTGGRLPVVQIRGRNSPAFDVFMASEGAAFFDASVAGTKSGGFTSLRDRTPHLAES